MNFSITWTLFKLLISKIFVIFFCTHTYKYVEMKRNIQWRQFEPTTRRNSHWHSRGECSSKAGGYRVLNNVEPSSWAETEISANLKLARDSFQRKNILTLPHCLWRIGHIEETLSGANNSCQTYVCSTDKRQKCSILHETDLEGEGLSVRPYSTCSLLFVRTIGR